MDYVDLSQSNVVEEGCSFATKDKGMQSIKEPERVHETLVSQLPAFSSLAATQSLDATLAVAGERLESMQAGFGGSTDLSSQSTTAGSGSSGKSAPEDNKRRRRFDLDAATLALQSRACRELSSVAQNAKAQTKEAQDEMVVCTTTVLCIGIPPPNIT